MQNIDLLQVFHERASSDPARSGLFGKLCIAVAKPDGIARWVAECTQERDTFAYVDAIPAECDALLLASEHDLLAAFAGEALGDDAQIAIRGDAELFHAFCERYFRTWKPHELRSAR